MRINFSIILLFLLAGFLGLISALIILHLFHIFEGQKDHTFLYHWFFAQPSSHALSIIFSFILIGFLAAEWNVIRDRLKTQRLKAKVLEEVSQARTEMVSFVSHQLRAPISSLKWALRMLLEGEYGRVSGEQKDILTKIYKTNENLEGLIAEFLDVSKLEVEKLEIVFKNVSLADLEKEIKEVVERIKPIIKEKNLNFNYLSLLNQKLFVLADLKRIVQVVESLLENAINYTLSGGKIEIRLENDSTNFKVNVSDTGIGIPKEEQSRIFQKFFRAKNAKRIRSTGTGLGIYLCQKFIEGHRGKIWFISEEGKGTDFIFIIPLKAKVGVEELFRKI